MSVKAVPVDGFLLNCRLKWLPERYAPNALGQLDFLRHSTDYRARWYGVPQDPSQVIGAGRTLLYQVRVVPGSWLWGWSFASIGIGEDQFYVQIGDKCTNKTFFSSPVTGNALRSTDTTANIFPVLFAQPYLVRAPGLLDVQITNRDVAVDRIAQLLIHAAEPCVVFDELGP